MSDCSNHKKDLFGHTDMKEVAEAAGDLHYEPLSELYHHLAVKLNKDAKRDASDSKVNLSIELMNAAHYTELAYLNLRRAWQISKPFMEPENKKEP